MFHLLQAPIKDSEIKNIAFGIKPLKAPGMDGPHAIFYQSQWSTIGVSFCSFIKNIFAMNHISTEINITLLVLIPKSDSPISLKMYRPISLCTVVYKTMTKIVANRFEKYSAHLISPP